jgi:hypothetical protein
VSRSGLRFVRGVRRETSTRYLSRSVGPVWILQKALQDTLHSSVSGVQNVDALFFKLRWPGAVYIRSVSGHVAPNLCFLIRWDLQVT